MAPEQTPTASGTREEAASELGRRALERVPVDDLVREALALAGEWLEAEYALFLENDAGELTIRASAGLELSPVPASCFPEESIARRALRAPEPVVVDELDREAGAALAAPPAVPGARSCAGVAVRGLAEPHGLLLALSREPGAFSEEDGSFLGEIARVLGTAIELERGEAALRASVKQLSDMRAALDEAAIVAITDRRGVITFVNDKFCEISKYSREELIGQDHRIINSRYHGKEFFRGLWTTIGRGEVWRGQIRNRAKDGTLYWVDTTIVPFLDELGKPFQYVAIRSEISELKRAEARIREQAALLDKATDAIFVRDVEDRLLFWSKGAERLYGWTASEVAGIAAADLIFHDVPQVLDEAWREVLASGEWRGEIRQVTKDSRAVVVDSRWSLVRDERGEPRAVLAINTDITEKKSLEAQVLRAQRMESIGTLASGIAHDLNNVLSPILTAVQLLELRAPDDDTRRLLAVLRGNAERGGEMVKHVLAFARGAAGQHVLLQPRHLVREVVSMLRETLPKSVEIRSQIPPDLWSISGDATQLHQVLMNLCVNARDAMPQGGRLTIEAENVTLDESYARMHLEAKPGRFVLLSVADTGHGMAASTVDKIFEPFYTTKGPGKGTGLGLSTVLGIVKGHGGFVNVYSEVGKGTSFGVYLPVASIDEPESADEAAARLPRGRGELVLVVDDEAAIREVTAAALRAFGYRVLTAGDGAEAVALFVEHRSDVRAVLLDMMMPIMDGPATVRALRRIEPEVKIVGASGLAESDKVREATSEGLMGFIQKPYTAETVLVALDGLLHAPERPE